MPLFLPWQNQGNFRAKVRRLCGLGVIEGALEVGVTDSFVSLSVTSALQCDDARESAPTGVV